MASMKSARRDAAVLALVQATARLEVITRIVAPRAGRDPVARRLLAVLDVVRPIIAAVENLIPDPGDPNAP